MTIRGWLFTALLFTALPAIAEETPPSASSTTPAPNSAPASTGQPSTASGAGAGSVNGSGALEEGAVLTPEEKAEKDARKACKAEICGAFRNPTASGRDEIACDVLKSWRKEQLVKMTARLKVTWPYGPVKCTSALKLKRADLSKAMTEAKHQAQLEKHAVSCEVARENDTATQIKFEFSPQVTFEKGKAIFAKMNWGKIEAPALVKGAMWTATAADNTVNMLSSSLVEDINDFVGKKCDEVKTDPPSPAP